MPTSKKRSAKKHKRLPHPCPSCASTDVVAIVWGFPGEETFAEAKEGQVALGGCVISDDDPTWHCNACSKDFGRSGAAEAFRRGRHSP